MIPTPFITQAEELTARAIAAGHYTRKFGKGVAMPKAQIAHRVNLHWKTFLPDARIVLAALAEFGVLTV